LSSLLRSKLAVCQSLTRCAAESTPHSDRPGPEPCVRRWPARLLRDREHYL